MLSYIPPSMYSVCAPSYLVILINPFPIMSPRACPRALLLVFGPKVPLLLVYAHLLTTHLLSEIDNLYQLICSLLVTLVRQRDPSPSLPSHMYVSGLGIVPKKNGKLRVIHDLSSPDGESVNDGIPREDFSPEYATVDMAISHNYNGSRPGGILDKSRCSQRFPAVSSPPC